MKSKEDQRKIYKFEDLRKSMGMENIGLAEKAEEERLKTIEKKLQAFEIIKLHHVNVDDLMRFFETADKGKECECYNAYIEYYSDYWLLKLEEDEVELLKEVLFNEK